MNEKSTSPKLAKAHDRGTVAGLLGGLRALAVEFTVDHVVRSSEEVIKNCQKEPLKGGPSGPSPTGATP